MNNGEAASTQQQQQQQQKINPEKATQRCAWVEGRQWRGLIYIEQQLPAAAPVPKVGWGWGLIANEISLNVRFEVFDMAARFIPCRAMSQRAGSPIVVDKIIFTFV